MENKSKPLIIELIIDETQNIDGVNVVSIVDEPAIEVDFMYFNKNMNNTFKFKNVNEEKRLATGPFMIPDKQILRVDEQNNPYFVFFSEDTVRKSNELYMKKGGNLKYNTNHKDIVDGGAIVIESWIVEDPNNDKANALGFTNLPKGTWMGTYKIYDDKLWSQIKSGEFKGFSIEGPYGYLFNKTEVNLSEEIIYEFIKNIINSDIESNNKFDIISTILNKN